jgi:excisionase family DNA binding protein
MASRRQHLGDDVGGGFGGVRRHHGRGLPQFYNVNEVAKAAAVSPRTVRRWVATGELVVHRLHGVVRIADADLKAFLAIHRDG